MTDSMPQESRIKGSAFVLVQYNANSAHFTADAKFVFLA